MPVDRPAEDDTPRATTPDTRAADPPPPEEHESPDRMAYIAEHRATVEAVIHAYQAARQWDEAVPALRQAWQDHEKKWTQPERAAPTGHPEVPGSWHGDGGRYLAPDANAQVTRGCARIRELGETVITPAIRNIEAEDPTRHLTGLDHRLKGENRLKEKVARTVEEQPGLSAGQALSGIPDAVRFTFCYTHEHYSAGARADVERLTARGFELAKPLKNSWSSDQYKGINTQWREPGTGQLFEVQFHTVASFEAKQLTHGAYERIRNPEVSGAELEELEHLQRQVCSKIPIPPGAADIHATPRKERDG
jgi:hypothetical protein